MLSRGEHTFWIQGCPPLAARGGHSARPDRRSGEHAALGGPSREEWSIAPSSRVDLFSGMRDSPWT
jgi:hypothetical protein